MSKNEKIFKHYVTPKMLFVMAKSDRSNIVQQGINKCIY